MSTGIWWLFILLLLRPKPYAHPHESDVENQRIKIDINKVQEKNRIAPNITTHAEPGGSILARKEARPKRNQPTAISNQLSNTPSRQDSRSVSEYGV